MHGATPGSVPIQQAAQSPADGARLANNRGAYATTPWAASLIASEHSWHTKRNSTARFSNNTSNC